MGLKVEQERPPDIWTPRGCKSRTGKSIKRWITYYSTPGNSDDAIRCQIARNMLRFLNIEDEQWYWCELRRKKGKYIPNLERIERVRRKNAKERHSRSIWAFRRRFNKSQRYY